MVKNAFKKSIFREIKQSLERYLAILSIVALGVGFFAGLQITQKAMLATGNDYVSSENMYDFKLISDLGLTDDDVTELSKLNGIKQAIGSYTADAYCTVDGGKIKVVKFHSLTDSISTPSLISGRLPEKDGECVADGRMFSEGEDVIGKKINLTDENEKGTLDGLSSSEYVIVGTVNSVNYMNLERGSSSLNGGKTDGFVYLPSDSFKLEYFTEVYLDADAEYEIYSKEYNDRINGLLNSVEEKLSERAAARYDELLSLVPLPMRSSVNIPMPQTYVLTRSDNVGYSCFESDSQIVKGIAKVFPVFFFAVAALVCTTTMTRMVSEQRTQIGTLKALGYTKSAILSKYVLYSGSSSLIGAVVGYFAGTWLFPYAIWTAYSILYGFSSIKYVFNLPLLLVSVAAALLCSAGVTYAVCKKELYNMPSELMRPKAPKAGRRILLERISFIWKRLSFLRKVSLRNIFRYRKRLYMMILGVGGCTALLLTGFGIRDSIADIAEYQFDEISKYDYIVCFRTPRKQEEMKEFNAALTDEVTSSLFVCQTDGVAADTSGGLKNVTIIASDDENITDFFDLHDAKKEAIPFPSSGEVVISEKLASQMGAKLGDDVTLSLNDEGTEKITLKLSGICKSYVYNYAYMTSETYEAATGKPAEYLYAYAKAPAGANTLEEGAHISAISDVTLVSVTRNMRERVENMMRSLNLVVWLVIASAAALAFIVLANLSNINITERQREIATIKVLGFYPRETSAYVFRENVILTLMGAFVGLPMGMALHRFAVSQIKVDIISIDAVILPVSYLLALALTLIFTVAVDLIMRRKLKKIDMAESLKSIE